MATFIKSKVQEIWAGSLNKVAATATATTYSESILKASHLIAIFKRKTALVKQIGKHPQAL